MTEEADDTSDSLRAKIRKAINQCSAENGSDTPDFILAEFLMDCLQAFDYALQKRADWYRSQDPPWRTTGAVRPPVGKKASPE